MLRELTNEELGFVGGGDGVITVYAPKTGTVNSGSYSVGNGDGAGGLGSGLSSFQFMDLSGLSGLANFDFANWDPTGAYTNDPNRTPVDNDGDGLDDLDDSIIVISPATHGQIQAANLLASIDLWVMGIFSAPIGVLGGEALAGLTLAQRMALASGAAAGAPITNAAIDAIHLSSFNRHLDVIQNPESYPRNGVFPY